MPSESCPSCGQTVPTVTEVAYRDSLLCEVTGLALHAPVPPAIGTCPGARVILSCDPLAEQPEPGTPEE